jgi:1,2-diacylglycerol 3-beta-galactosyltransferase
VGQLRVGFIISDTGGGHRAGAKAVAAALEHLYPGKFETVFIDVFRAYSPFPWRYAPDIYPLWVKWSTPTYGLSFWLTDYALRLPYLGQGSGLFRLPGERILARIVTDHRPDVLVVIHSIPLRALASARRALGLKVPLVAVVTDIGRPHRGWFHPDVDLCIVTSDRGARLAREAGLSPDKVVQVGPLVHPKFVLSRLSRAEAREKLGWDEDTPTVLLLGGGEGMGKLVSIARAIDKRLPDSQLAVVCGRNEKLKRKLASLPWRLKLHLYGFVDHMELLMWGADVVVTKAGPLTIGEALASGLPTIIYGAIPFQETGNIRLVVDSGAGVYLTSPRRIAETLAGWFSEPAVLARHAAAAHRIASPESAFQAAAEIARLCGLS